MNIAEVIAWKFNNQPGMRCAEDETGVLRVVEFPGGIPTQAEQDAWAAEYLALKVTDDVWGEIKTERDTRKAGGVLVSGKWFHTDDASRIQHLGLVMMGANMPAGIQWKTMDGSFVEMTPALALAIFNAAAALDMAVFQVAETHRVAMMASPNPLAYDYSTGWPVVYA